MPYDPAIQQRAAFKKVDIQRFRAKAKTLGWKEAGYRGPQRLLERIAEEWLVSEPKRDPEPSQLASATLLARVATLEARLALVERNIRMEVQ